MVDPFVANAMSDSLGSNVAPSLSGEVTSDAPSMASGKSLRKQTIGRILGIGPFPCNDKDRGHSILDGSCGGQSDSSPQELMVTTTKANLELDDAQSFGGWVLEETPAMTMSDYQRQRRGGGFSGQEGRPSMGIPEHINSSHTTDRSVTSPPAGGGGSASRSGGSIRRSRSVRSVRSVRSDVSSAFSKAATQPCDQSAAFALHRQMMEQAVQQAGEGKTKFDLDYAQEQLRVFMQKQQMMQQARSPASQSDSRGGDPWDDEPLGEEYCYNDSMTINSDTTGLTGAFSLGPEGFEDEDEFLMQDEPDVEPLAYPVDVKAYNDQEAERARGARRNNRVHRGGPQHSLRVTFANVNVRVYEREIGDNPSTVSGPPIGISWNFREIEEMSVEAWEYTRYGSVGKEPRSSRELLLDREEREQMLLEMGYSKKEIAAAVRAIVRDKNRRRQTVQNLNSQGFEETMESVTGGLKRMLWGTSGSTGSSSKPTSNVKIVD